MTRDQLTSAIDELRQYAPAHLCDALEAELVAEFERLRLKAENEKAFIEYQSDLYDVRYKECQRLQYKVDALRARVAELEQSQSERTE
jgi:polyhydroxyalkanoate synthesis regulator phasin